MNILPNPIAVAFGTGIGFLLVVTFVLAQVQVLPDARIVENYLPATRVEILTEYNQTAIPDMYLVWKDTAYAGREGTYCWGGVCADFVFITPSTSIIIDQGSEIKFYMPSHELPDILGISISQDTLFQGYHNIASVKPVRAGNHYAYTVDLQRGDYIFQAGATWKDGDFAKADSTYYYKIRVV